MYIIFGMAGAIIGLAVVGPWAAPFGLVVGLLLGIALEVGVQGVMERRLAYSEFHTLLVALVGGAARVLIVPLIVGKEFNL